MRVLAVLTAVFALALAAPAGAQFGGEDEEPEQCAHPASTYSSGGSPGQPPANDPLYPKQWGLSQIGAAPAWLRGARGAGTIIAVVDTGVDYSHPDLQGKLLEGADFVEGDDDNCPGAQDEDGHGTHVAGIAAAVTNNGIGVAGTATDAMILPVRVLDDEGSGEVEWITKGIRYAADQGATVINLSLGDPVPIRGQAPNREYEDAVNYAWSKGSVVVAAAGNESTPACSYPSAADNAICVAATDRRRAPSFYSNFPADPDGTVGVRAPGGFGTPFCENDEDIWSTFWPDSDYGCEDPEFEDQIGYETLAGTSQAAPFVSGLAAMLRGMGLSNAQTVECIRTKSSNRGRYDPVMGWGIIDADTATRECSQQSTPAFAPPPGTENPPIGSGQGTAQQQGLIVSVRVHRTTRRKLRRTGRLRVTVTTNRATRVRVFAHMTRSRRTTRRGGRVVGRKRFVFTQAGKKRGRIKLDRQARRSIRSRRRGYRIQVRWEAEGLQGIATPARAR